MAQQIDIVEVVEGAGVTLKKSGREFIGLCPFHGDKHPSLSVNAEKNVFHCFSCGAGGDAIAFVMELHGFEFREAIKHLGIDDRVYKPKPLTARRKRAAALAAKWVTEQRKKFNTMIAEAMERRDIADEIGDFELAEIFDRELLMVNAFYDALGYSTGAAEMLALRSAIASITDGAGVSL